MEVTWRDVLSSIDNLLMETEIQDNNSDFRVPRSDISPQQTRNGGICLACNSGFGTGFRQEHFSNLGQLCGFR